MGNQNDDIKKILINSQNQSAASCFNFTEGGIKHEFYINKEKGTVCWENGEYGGEYFCMEDGYKTAHNFIKEKIKIKKIAASCNRVFCYGKDDNGRHRFFWSQIVDSFPGEPGGSLPGLFDGNCDNNEYKNELCDDFDDKNKNTGNHPFWGIQRLAKTVSCPVIVKAGNWYEISLPCHKQMAGIGVDLPFSENKEKAPLKDSIKEVIDIGVADIERYENYNTMHGGEIQAWRYSYALEDTLFAFPIGPNANAQDANGFNDGTCNFFILAKVDEGYSILWCDEQAGPSEYWRRLTPNDSVYHAPIVNLTQVHSWINSINNGQLATELLSLIASAASAIPVIEAIRRNGSLNKFNDNFDKSMPYGKDKKPNKEGDKEGEWDLNVNKLSRMAVSRYPILLTTKDEIFSISFMWGTTDFCWNRRPYPKKKNVYKAQKLQEEVYYEPGTIEIRDDTTIYMFGSYKKGVNRGVFYQNYMPQRKLKDNYAKIIYSKRSYDHEWRFVLWEVFQAMDKYYNFGIYDAWSQNNDILSTSKREPYAYEGINARTQFYVVKVIEGDIEKLKEMQTIVWDCTDGKTPLNPIFEGYNYKIPLEIMLRWDEVYKIFIAVYSHPRNNDLKKDMSSLLSWELSLRKKESKKWKPVGSDKPQYKFEFYSPEKYKEYNGLPPLTRFCFSPPAVQKATLKFNSQNNKIVVTIEPTEGEQTIDPKIRYITVGAVVDGGDARPISKRYPVGAAVDENGKAISKCYSLNEKGSKEFILELSDDLKIKTNDWFKELFKADSHMTHGTSVWFENILGHKSTPEELVIDQ